MLAFLAFAAAANSPPDITGDWVTADGTAIVRIASCGIQKCGIVIRILAKGPAVPQTDVNNPDRARRSHKAKVSPPKPHGHKRRKARRLPKAGTP